MKALLYGEWELALRPTHFIFLLCALVLLIPSYPYYVAFYYTTLGIFFIFLTGRETRDIEFTVLLPIRKRDCVYARFFTVAVIELTQILISVPFALLSIRINPVGGNQAGMDLSVGFYGLIFLLYTIFNLCFVVPFYKTGYKAGRYFLLASLLMFGFMGMAEALLHLIPGAAAIFDSSAAKVQGRQLPLLLAGIAIYTASAILGARRAAKLFEKVDL